MSPSAVLALITGVIQEIDMRHFSIKRRNSRFVTKVVVLVVFALIFLQSKPILAEPSGTSLMNALNITVSGWTPLPAYDDGCSRYYQLAPGFGKRPRVQLVTNNSGDVIFLSTLVTAVGTTGINGVRIDDTVRVFNFAVPASSSLDSDTQSGWYAPFYVDFIWPDPSSEYTVQWRASFKHLIRVVFISQPEGSAGISGKDLMKHPSTSTASPSFGSKSVKHRYGFQEQTFSEESGIFYQPIDCGG